MKKMNNLNLDELRERLDHVNYALVLVLAERFRLTDMVGEYKKDHNLAVVDEGREEEQIQKMEKLAEELGLEAQFARKCLRLIIDEVRLRHQAIRDMK
jgi:chorismate mutase